MAATSTARHHGSYHWLPILGALFIIAGLALGALLSGGFGATLRFGLLVLGFVYFVAYTYVNWRAQQVGSPLAPPSRWTRRLRWLMLGSAVAFAASVMLHNLISALIGGEEALFFIIAVLVAPLTFLVSATGAAVVTILAASRSTPPGP